jgi:hypothetical protein
MFKIIKADYLQRTRSYAFLITLAITAFMAYSFVPPLDASYKTLNASGYKGAYNSAWVGYVTAIMTTVMLSFYGFLLVNSGIKKDIETEVGLIIATSPISNFRYLLCKQLSNFLVLITIAGCIFVISILMFFLRNTGYPFIFSNFLFPYVLFALPALFIVASLAVVAEVFLPRKGILQYIIYFFLCGAMMAFITKQEDNSPIKFLDPFGLSMMTNSIRNQINVEFHDHIKQVGFGFIHTKEKSFKIFEWNGLEWKNIFLVSRLFWITFGIALVYGASFFFHRFDFKVPAGKKKKNLMNRQDSREPVIPSLGINWKLLPPIVVDYSILPFIKTEFLLLVRKGNKWLWLINAALWLSLFFAPLTFAHIYLLPVLLFLQVSRWSDLATKEKTHRLHFFSYASYKPLLRMLPAQILAGIILALALALPLILRYGIALNGYAIINIINGAVLIVLLAVCLGIISGGKKLFEILFFLLTYTVLNKMPFADYLGSTMHHNQNRYLAIIYILVTILASTSFFVRAYQSRHL